MLAKEGFWRELKSGRGEPRQAEPNSRFSTATRSSPRARGDVVATFALLRRDGAAWRGVARRGAAANEVSRTAARSVTKERNIAGRDITVATLLSAYRIRARTEGNDIVHVYLAEIRRNDNRGGGPPLRPFPSPLVPRGGKKKKKIVISYVEPSRPSRFLSSLSDSLLVPLVSKRAIFTASSRRPLILVCRRAEHDGKHACFVKKDSFASSSLRLPTTWGTTPKGDALLRKKFRVLFARTSPSPSPPSSPLPSPSSPHVSFLTPRCYRSSSFSIEDGARKGMRFGTGR